MIQTGKVLVPETLELHIDRISECDEAIAWNTICVFVYIIHVSGFEGQAAYFLPGEFQICSYDSSDFADE